MPTDWTPDFIAIYFPNLTDLAANSARIQSARNRIEAWLRNGWPNSDMRPNSPLGDLILTPFAYLLAAIEVASGRWMSDADLSNVASGTVWNCLWVQAFIENFGSYAGTRLQSTGLIRLIFNTDQIYILDRSVQFTLGSNTFNLRLIFPGNLTIKPVGSVPDVNGNSIVLTDLGNQTYAADVPVYGTMGAVVSVNDTASLSIQISQLISASALVNFTQGSPATSVQELAKVTKLRFPNASLTNPAGARAWMSREFPEIIASSSVQPGDSIAMRPSINPLGITQPAIDLYAKSNQYDNATTQTIALYFNSSLNKFVGKLALAGNPIFISSITSQANSSISFIPGVSMEIFSQSNDAAEAPLLTCAGTPYETLWASFNMPVDTNGSSLISLTTDGAGKQFAYFNVNYVYDPLFPYITARLSDPDVRPPIDILPRPFIPIVITRFNVRYTKAPNAVMTLNNAQLEIFNYLRQVAYPEFYSDSRIADAMFYNQADSVVGIDILARVWFSAATKILPAGTVGPDVNYATAEAAALLPPALTINSSKGLVIKSYVDPDLGSGDETMAAIGLKNLTYLINQATITFSEELLV